MLGLRGQILKMVEFWMCTSRCKDHLALVVNYSGHSEDGKGSVEELE